MSILKASQRDFSRKGKQLRKEGIIPGNIYGKNLDASVSVQLNEHDLAGLLKSKSEGSQVEVAVGKENYLTMIKEVKYLHMGKGIEHIDFQVLTQGEKARVSVSINFLNKDLIEVEGILQEMLKEIEYEAMPVDMIDHVDVDLANLKIGDTIKISDLPIASDPRFNIITGHDNTVAIITSARFTDEEEDADAEDVDAEVALVSDSTDKDA